MTSRSRSRPELAALGALVALAAGCGGGSPFDNAPPIENPAAQGGQKLSFVYYQKCIEPVLRAPLKSGNTCAGCHDSVNGTGGAFRLLAGAQPIDVATTRAEAIRASDMYRNFYSAQGSTVIGAAELSRLLTKPLVQGVLHGGGQVFDSAQDPYARLIAYWIERPVPQGQDEFSVAAGDAMFTPPDAASGTCNSR